MPEHNSTLPIDNADASGEALVMKVSFSERHDDFKITWNIKSIDAYLVVIRYNFDGTVHSEQRINQANETSDTYNLEQNYNLKFYVEISENGSVTKTSNEVIVSPKGLIFEGGDQILTESIFGNIDGAVYDLILRRKPRTFNIIDGLITFAKTTNFIYEDIQSVILYYRSVASTNWTSLGFNYQRGSDIFGGVNEELVGYTINFDNLEINVPTEGSTMEFYVEIASKNLSPQKSSTKSVKFTPLSPTQSLLPDSNSINIHPNPYKPAGLRYEITSVISESYYEVNRGTTESFGESKDFYHFFSDEDDFGGIKYALPDGPASDFKVGGGNKSKHFVYEADYGINSQNYKGFIYPASISEILPCINVIGSGEQKQIKLSWKIIDDFFDYQLYAGQLRVVTTELKVNIKYYNSGSSSYVNLISDFILTSTNYISSLNTFVVVITGNQVKDNLTLFDEISVDDNATDNLVIEVVSHKVNCTVGGEDLRTHELDKLLLPPRWTHIVYDRFILDYSERNSDGTFSLDIFNKKLRGIRLPERGFKIFDEIENVKSAIGSEDNYKIIYKLKTQTNAIYSDPIREGTITYVDIGQQPDNVFLTPPILKLPNPNIDPFGKKAEGEVVLDEYGKIAGVRILDPGYGYSMFKTEADKRIQTFVDFVPVIKSSYKVLNSNLGITKGTLTPVNNSFSRLKASIEGGYQLNNIGANQGALTSEQKAVLEDYKSRNDISDANEQNDPDNNIYNRDLYVNTLNNSYNAASLEVLDPEWYSIVSLYNSKTLAPSDDFAIYNEDLDPAAVGLDGSKVSDTINSASNSAEIVDVDITNENQVDLVGNGSVFSLNSLDVYTDASAASSVFKSSSVPPWLTIEPLEVRRDGAPAYGALPYMLTRASSFFNRISVGVNHLNKVRLILPSIWDTRTTTVTTDYTETNNLTGFQLSQYSSSGEVSRRTRRTQSYYPSNSGVGLGARVSRSVSLQPQGIVSSEINQSQTIYPKIHPWLKQSIPDIFTRKVDKNFLAIQITHVSSCSFYNTDSLVCGTSRISIPETVNVPENTLDGPNRSIKIFNGGTIRLTPYGTSYNLNIGDCNYNCGDMKDITLDFKYSNLYPYILKI